MGKSTISMVIFHSYVTHYQRVTIKIVDKTRDLIPERKSRKTQGVLSSFICFMGLKSALNTGVLVVIVALISDHEQKPCGVHPRHRWYGIAPDVYGITIV